MRGPGRAARLASAALNFRLEVSCYQDQNMTEIELPIQDKSSRAWAKFVAGHFGAFLQDHAACERKAAALAMSFVARYPDRPALVEPMIALAREELEHFHQVFRLMRRRGLSLASGDQKDPYINMILQELRHGRDERLLDRLIMSALVEARGYERFALLADVLDEPELKGFYSRLSESEAGHYRIFVRIAKHYFSESQINEALDRISSIENKAMKQAPLRAALH